MPSPKQQEKLVWETFKDFTAGLWQTGDDRECPRNGLLALTDAFPLREGGLRAWGTWHAMDMTGIPDNSYIFGIFHIPGPASGPLFIGGLYIHILVVNAGGAGNHTFQLRKFNGTVSGAGTWDLLKSITGLTEFLPAQHMQSFRMSTGGVFSFRDFYNVALNASSVRGIYKTDGTTVSTANTRAYDANIANVVLAHQGRLLDVEIESFIQNMIRYTSVASDVAPTTNQFTIPIGEISAPITWMAAIPPSDLFLHKQEVGLVNIQGDITNPIVRQMNWSHSFTRTYPVMIDEGLVMSSGSDSIYVWTGGQLLDLAPSLLANPTSADQHGQINGVTQGGEPSFTVPGDTYEFHGRMGASEVNLFAGKNYLMDLRNKAWFLTSTSGQSTNGTAKYYAVDRFNHYVFHTRSLSMQTGRQLIWWEDIREDNWTRATSYSFTLPLIFSNHGYTQLRSVEVYVHTFGSGSTAVVSMQSTDSAGALSTTTLNTYTFPATANNYVARFDMPGNSSQSFKVSVTLAASGTTEAPMLEKVLVGTQASAPVRNN